jgi:hypothetical protein
LKHCPSLSTYEDHGSIVSHYANECRFKEAIYHKCNKKGHIKKACKGKKISDIRKLHLLGDNEDDESDSYGIYSVTCEITDTADPVSNYIGILTFSTHGLITIASFAYTIYSITIGFIIFIIP